MSRLRKQADGGAARKSSPSRLKSKFKVGDRVRVVEIPDETKYPNADLMTPEAREMRTAELFRFCLGRVFTIYGFGPYGHAELRVDKSPAVRNQFGWSDTIWMEPEFLELARRRAAAKA